MKTIHWVISMTIVWLLAIVGLSSCNHVTNHQHEDAVYDDSVAVVNIVNNVLRGPAITSENIIDIKRSRADDLYLDSMFLHIPEGVLVDITRVLENRRPGVPIDISMIVQEYNIHKDIYSNIRGVPIENRVSTMLDTIVREGGAE